ncbi:MAG: SBBP repeat-containing protein [Acidobacteria bacterium]|nr:SBBP repeat-containing protein [Acidobacteriota bacterium]
MNLIHKTLTVTTMLASIVSANPIAALRFERNLGQTDAQVKYVARAAGHSLLFTEEEAVLVTKAGASLRLRPIGRPKKPAIIGENAHPGTASYYIGNDPSKWITKVPVYRKLRYSNIYPGVDLTYYGTDGQLEYDFEVAPRADASVVGLSIEGARALSLQKDGGLRILTTQGESNFAAPVAFQTINGERRTVAAAYRIEGNTVRFQLGAYDRSQRLVIDPLLVYSTLLGGTGEDHAYGVAADSTGSAVVVGSTASIDFPRTLRQVVNGSMEAFVTKFSATGGSLVFSLYLGGSNSEYAAGVALDKNNNIYVTGATYSTNFPVLQAFQSSLKGVADFFVTKFSPTGVMQQSTYLGGDGYDFGAGITVDPLGMVWVCGRAEANFPTTSGAVQPALAGLPGDFDTVVARLNMNNGVSLLAGTYLGGKGFDEANSIAFDSNTVWIRGDTRSSDFPLKNEIQSALGGGSLPQDAVVAQFSIDLKTLLFSTYLGGNGDDSGFGIAADKAHNIYVTGNTGSANFPVREAIQPQMNGQFDAFVVKLLPGQLLVSTFLGGGAGDDARGIAVDGDGQVHVAGYTCSANFPTASPIQPALGGLCDAFVTQFKPGLTGIVFSTFLGGADHDFGAGITVNSQKRMFVVGSSNGNFPLQGAFQPINNGNGDAFVTVIQY